MDHPNLHAYLGEELLLNQFTQLASNVRDALPPGPATAAIDRQITKLDQKTEVWPSKLVDTTRNRQAPVFNQEEITKLNQTYNCKVDEINDKRKRSMETLNSELVRRKERLDKMKDSFAARADENNKILSRSRAIIANLRSGHIVFNTDLQSQAIVSRESEIESYEIFLNQHDLERTMLESGIEALEMDLSPIRTISKQHLQKYWFIPGPLSYQGWLPTEDKFTLIASPKVPSEPEILRHCSYEPESRLSNLPLSIYNLIIFADKIGAPDETLLTIILIYMKKYKESILDCLDTKKTSLAAVINQISYHATTIEEKKKIQLQLQNFRREVQEPFAAAVSRFDSLFIFYIQLDMPSEVHEIKLLSLATLRTVAPYLISPRCAKSFGAWIQDSLKLGTEITKQSIIKTISSLENHAELQLTSPRTLPPHLASTALNLPPAQEEVSIQAHFVGAKPPLADRKYPFARPRTRTPPTDHRNDPKYQNRSPNTVSRNTRPLTPRTQSGTRIPRPVTPGNTRRPSFSSTNGTSTTRTQSKSPNRNYRTERGRSVDKVIPSARAPSSDSHALQQIDAMQFHSIHSTENDRRKKSMAGVFRRPLTPNTYQHLKNNFFMKTNNPERFKDVFSSKRCLRCYGLHHLASTCRRFTQPCPEPCRNCHFLYHDSALCPFYDKYGKSRPPTPSRDNPPRPQTRSPRRQ